MPRDAFQSGGGGGGGLTDAELRASPVPVDTELPAAAALADNAPNPTVPGVGANALVWDGAGWDRMAQPLTDAQLRAAAVPVSLSEPISVDDNGGSLTVDIGAPVTLGRVDVSATLAGTPKIQLTDFTDDATILPVRTQPATTEKGLPAPIMPSRMPVYGCAMTTVTPAITIGVKELLAIWSASGDAKDKYIMELWATVLVTTASTAGRTALRVSLMTSAPTGGTELAKADLTGAGASGMTNTMQVKTGGGALGTTFIRKLTQWTTTVVGRYEVPIFQAQRPEDAIILRGGVSSGISIDIEREVAHTALVDLWTVGARWLEL